MRPATRSTTSPTPTPHECTAWLRQRIADRVAAIRAAGWELGGSAPHIIAPLGEPAGVGSIEDRTCDRCRRYVASPHAFVVFELRPTPGLSLVGGLCGECFGREVSA